MRCSITIPIGKPERVCNKVDGEVRLSTNAFFLYFIIRSFQSTPQWKLANGTVECTTHSLHSRWQSKNHIYHSADTTSVKNWYYTAPASVLRCVQCLRIESASSPRMHDAGLCACVCVCAWSPMCGKHLVCTILPSQQQHHKSNVSS